MDSTSGYTISRPQIIREQFDEEVVIVDLETGSYYALGGAGGEIWSALESGASQQQIVEQMKRNYSDEPETIETAVIRLLDELQQETLIAPRPLCADDGLSTPNVQDATMQEPAQCTAWQTPVLQKFTDMQALLLLDPIHEVDSSGWPQIKPEEPTATDKSGTNS